MVRSQPRPRERLDLRGVERDGAVEIVPRLLVITVFGKTRPATQGVACGLFRTISAFAVSDNRLFQVGKNRGQYELPRSSSLRPR